MAWGPFLLRVDPILLFAKCVGRDATHAIYGLYSKIYKNGIGSTKLTCLCVKIPHKLNVFYEIGCNDKPLLGICC
jgi:hypothetical protein